MSSVLPERLLTLASWLRVAIARQTNSRGSRQKIWRPKIFKLPRPSVTNSIRGVGGRVPTRSRFFAVCIRAVRLIGASGDALTFAMDKAAVLGFPYMRPTISIALDVRAAVRRCRRMGDG